MILETSLLRRLDRLSLVARRVRAGQTAGERRSTKRGTSVEFADYRDYAKGDDLRRVDWNIYARLERPFVKLFEEEEDLAVHLLLDGQIDQLLEGLPRGAPQPFDGRAGHGVEAAERAVDVNVGRVEEFHQVPRVVGGIVVRIGFGPIIHSSRTIPAPTSSNRAETWCLWGRLIAVFTSLR